MDRADGNEDIEKLIDYLKDRTASSLRLVYSYDSDGNIERHYVRNDVDNPYELEEIKSLIERAIGVDRSIRTDDLHSIDENEVVGVGVPLTSFHTYSEAVVLQVFCHGGGGVVASFETDVADRHTSFVRTVRDHLGEEDIFNRTSADGQLEE